MSSYQFRFLKNQVKKQQQDYLHKYIYSLRKGDYLQVTQFKRSLHNFPAGHMHVALHPQTQRASVPLEPCMIVSGWL